MQPVKSALVICQARLQWPDCVAQTARHVPLPKRAASYCGHHSPGTAVRTNSHERKHQHIPHHLPPLVLTCHHMFQAPTPT